MNAVSPTALDTPTGQSSAWPVFSGIARKKTQTGDSAAITSGAMHCNWD